MTRARGLKLGALGILVVGTALVYLVPPGVLFCGFVWDDLGLVVEEDRYRGLTAEHLHWMFTTTRGGHYQPLTWLSYATDFLLFGLSPFALHLGNVLWHAVSAGCFFLVAKRLIRAANPVARPEAITFGALAAAVLFAWHPLRVESVAWITERRDVLSGMLLMAATLAYLSYVQKRSVGRLIPAVVLYGLSLLAKAGGVTWPFVLLLMDLYPLRRARVWPRKAEPSRTVGFAARNSARAETSLPSKDPGPIGGGIGGWKRYLAEKVPFLVPAILIALAALWAQGRAGALRSLEEHSLALRIAQAAYGVMFHIGKTIWPIPLCPLYEQSPHASPLDAPFVLSGILVVLVTLLAVAWRRRWPALLTAWVAYLVLLAPTLGFAQSGPQLVAERYSYLSCLPWALLLGAMGTRLWDFDSARARGAFVSRAALALLVVLSILLVARTRAQIPIWANGETLWSHVIAVRPRTGIAHANLAALHQRAERYELARKHAIEALDILPGNLTAIVALARASGALGDFATAYRYNKEACDIASHDPLRWLEFATAASRFGREEEAETAYRRAMNMAPDDASLPFAYAGFLAGRSQYEDALAYLKKTLAMDATHLDAWYRASVLYELTGKSDQAVGALQAGLAAASAGDARAARLKLRLAWILATTADDSVRDCARALALAEGAHRRDPTDVKAAESLAAALACAGRFTEAAEILRALLENQPNLSESMIVRIRDALSHYESGRPFPVRPQQADP